MKLVKFKIDNTWRLILIVICVCIFIYGLIFSNIKSPNIPYIVGLYLLYSIIIASIFYYAIVRRNKTSEALMSFLAIYLSFIISGTITGFINEHKLKVEANEIVNRLETRLDQSITRPAHEQINISRARKEGGTFSDAALGELYRWINECLDRSNEYNKAYKFELNSIGWENILNAFRLYHDKGLVESNNLINKAKVIENKYESKLDDIYEGNYHDIDNLALDDESKDILKRSYSESLAIIRPDIKRMWTLELSCILEIEKIINILSERGNLWSPLGDNKFKFVYDKDAEIFNGYIFNIQNIVKEQQLIQQRLNERSKMQIDRLKNIVN